MPRKFVKYLDGNNIYVCRKCRSHLTSLSELISTSFTAQSGQAYLFNHVINVKVGEEQLRDLRTGFHKIASIFCNICEDGKAIGWKYIWAEEEDQKYKEKKFILEKAYIKKLDQGEN